MPNRAFSKNPFAKEVEREPVAAVSCKPQHTADITLYALYQCKMRVFETSKAPLSVIRFKFWRCPPILLIMPVIVVMQETRDFFQHKEARVT
jgi:hypothetical protein